MTKLLLIASLLTVAPSAFAAKDLQLCQGQYLISVTTEGQGLAHLILKLAEKQKTVTIKDYNPKVGPFAMYSVAGATDTVQNETDALTIMQTMQQIPGAIIECNSTLSN